MAMVAGSDRVRVLGALALAVGCGSKHEAPPPPPEPCDPGPTVPGIDVSYHNDAIDWPAVRDAGVRFAFIRVSDGLNVDDPMFETYWSDAHRVGVLRGAYQFFRPEQSVEAQADRMIDALANDSGELPPVIDVEVDGGKRPAEIAKRVREWIARVRDKVGIDPIVYTGPVFWRDKAGGADVGSPLWVAHYTTACPTVPAPWTAWTYWQHTETGSVPGIEGAVDLDRFAGTIDDLLELTALR
jgi:lysozyme